jgi:hypothetical protein
MNPYETPNHTIEKSESELRIEKFENSAWGTRLKIFTRTTWSLVLVNTLIIAAIKATASRCYMVLPATNAECFVNGINMGKYVTYSLVYLIPVVVGLVVLNWLIRQILLFVFTLKH